MISKQTAGKYGRVYSCPDDIKNFKIRIKIKEMEVFNELDDKINENWISRTFAWQEKVFNKFEMDFYKNSTNCVTDLEKKFNKMLSDPGYVHEENSLLNSYINDEECPIDNEEKFGMQSYLPKLLENYRDEILDEDENEMKTQDFDYKKSLVQSMNNPVFCPNLENMWIVADFGCYSEDIWIKHEKLICNIKYDKTRRNLTIFPDFTTTDPYFLQIQDETTKNYYYFIENVSTKMTEAISMKETELINKIIDYKADLRKQMLHSTFAMPPKNKLNLYLFFEILSAKAFEYPNVYVQYFIDLPENWSCEDRNSLRGVTQICYGKNEEGVVHFGYCFEVVLNYNIQDLNGHSVPKSPYIYFEIISIDSWERYRTEGLTYKILPISTPGSYLYNLCCFRLSAQNLAGGLRRFFIGDCSNYDDLTWIGRPRDYERSVINKYGVNTIGTGQLNIRVNVLHQSQAFLKEYADYPDSASKTRDKLIFEKLNSSRLIKSVEEVLQAFKRARKNMIEARKNV